MATNNTINNAFGDNYTGPNKVSKNVIIGGDFGLNPWQRGVSGAASGLNFYIADRFFTSQVGTIALCTGSKAADAPTVSEAKYYTSSSLLYTVTTADASVDAADIIYIGHRIEGYNWAPLYTRPFVVSFWAKSNITGIYSFTVSDNSEANGYISEYTIVAANTWQFFSFAIPANTTGGTWQFTTSAGLRMNWVLMAGSNSTSSTLNTWGVNKRASTNQVNCVGTIGNTFQLALVQLEAGSIATPFELKTRQEVLAECQRYYAKTFPQGTTPAQNTGSTVGALIYNSSAISIYRATAFQCPVQMRTYATFTFYNPGAANSNWRNITDGADSGPSATLSSSQVIVYVNNIQTVTDGAGDILAIHATANAEL